jgi:hypothetical protein
MDKRGALFSNGSLMSDEKGGGGEKRQPHKRSI